MDFGDGDAIGRALRRSAETGLQMALDAGAEARVRATASRETRLAGESGQLNLANSIETATLDILVRKDERTGCAAINRLDDASLREAIEFAMSLARLSPADPGSVLATKAMAPPAEALDFQFDPALSELDLDAFQTTVNAAAACLEREPCIHLERYEGTISLVSRGVWNTLGVSQIEKQTLAGWRFLGAATDDDEICGYDYEAGFSFEWATLHDKCRQDAEALRRRLLGARKARKAPSYTGAVLIGPRAVQDLLIGPILHHASGRGVANATSRWVDAISTQVANGAIGLVERPRDPRFAAATAFDGDGVPTATTAILDKGVLVSHLRDVASASRLGRPTTGHADRALCVEMTAGPSSLLELTRAFPTLLLIARFSGNIDPVAGHYSGVAKSSRLYLGGEDASGVSETMIAGDFSDLMGPILAVSREVESVDGECIAPYVLVDGICVTGG